MKIAFFGDSITEGCFELFDNHAGSIENVRDSRSAYPILLIEKLRKSHPDTEIEMINAGVAGNSSADGLKRISEDVINKKPDVAVVCFGLNDAGQRKLDEYKNNLSEIFKRLNEACIKVIFMTPNMVNTYVHHLNLPVLYKIAKNCAECQNDGTMDAFMDAACECAKAYNVQVCDVYAIWKQMSKYGINTTELLANYINHPIRPMHKLFADALEPYIEALISQSI